MSTIFINVYTALTHAYGHNPWHPVEDYKHIYDAAIYFGNYKLATRDEVHSLLCTMLGRQPSNDEWAGFCLELGLT